MAPVSGIIAKFVQESNCHITYKFISDDKKATPVVASPLHSKIGAVHGKLGFLFIALAVWHTARRFRFYIR